MTEHKKLTDKINEAKYKARRGMDSADLLRKEHLEMGYKQDCDYYNHHTRLWEYHRGQYNLCVELEKSYEG